MEAQAGISGIRSLKDKRSLCSRVINEIRAKFSASVSETGLQDRLDSLCVGVAVACSDMAVAQRTAQALEDWFYNNMEFNTVDVESNIV